MAITPKELLHAAREMAAGTREVDWRNAACRAYYAAHHRCIPIMYGRASASPGHRQMIDDFLRKKTNTGFWRIGCLLRQCKILREKADYELEATFQIIDANSALGYTGRIFDIADPP